METSNRSFNKDLRRARSFRAQRDKSFSRNSSLANSRYVHCTLYTDVQYTYQVPLLLIQSCSSAVPTIWHRFQSKNWRLSLYSVHVSVTVKSGVKCLNVLTRPALSKCPPSSTVDEECCTNVQDSYPAALHNAGVPCNEKVYIERPRVVNFINACSGDPLCTLHWAEELYCWFTLNRYMRDSLYKS